MAKDTEIQNNEKYRLTSILRIIEAQENERLDANNNLRLVMEGFKSTALFDKDHVDERIIADAIKAHMTQMKQPPLVGQDVMGVNDGRAVMLGYVLTP